MTTEPEPQDTEHVEQINVENVPEPATPEEGVIDPDDTYTEGPAER